jgi:hypothetical protein
MKSEKKKARSNARGSGGGVTEVLAALEDVDVAPVRLHHELRDLALSIVLEGCAVLVHGLQQLVHSPVHSGAQRAGLLATLSRHGTGDTFRGGGGSGDAVLVVAHAHRGGRGVGEEAGGGGLEGLDACGGEVRDSGDLQRTH